MSIQVAIVDNDEAGRRHLARAVDGFPGCRCAGQFASAEHALRDLAAGAADVVLMEINLPGLSGIDCVHQLKSKLPAAEFIMFTACEETESVLAALAAGANGYLLKPASPNELLEAIKQVHTGGVPMTDHIARQVVQSFRQSTPASGNGRKLTRREQQILELLAKGFLYKEIAQSLTISYDTVHNHLRHIYEKLRVSSRTQAVAKYFAQARPQKSRFIPTKPAA